MKFSVNKTKQGLGELQTTLRWQVTIVSAASAVGAFDESLQIRIQSSGLPEAQVENTQVELQGHVINFPGKTIKNGELPWTFVEGTDAKVVAYFTKWDNARWSGDGSDTTGKSALTAALKADVKIELLGPDDVVTQTYTLVGAMPRIEKGATLAQTADAMMPNVTWTYDDYHQNAGGVNW